MSKRITVSLPDDVAEHLETVGERQVSRYVAEAVRAAARRERALAALEEIYVRVGRPSAEELARADEAADEALRFKQRRLGGAA